MNNVIGIGIPAYLVVGLIVVRQATGGTPFERCAKEKDNLFGARLMILLGALLWPVLLALKLFSSLNHKKKAHNKAKQVIAAERGKT